MKSAVLLLVFNRPATTQKVFEQIRMAKPPRLYVAADGPREGRNEEDLTEDVRKIATAVDWDCQLFTLFQPKNKGLRVAVIEAFTWFMDAEGEGILLEDDTLPSQDFFLFCDELLERYRHDPRVSGIGGSNLNYPTGLEDYSYFFSQNVAIWGWATWKRSWKNLGTYQRHREEVFQANGVLQVVYPDRYEYIFRRRNLIEAETGMINTWDYEFQLDSILQGALFIVPTQNMVVNNGFGENSTHTPDADSYFAKLQYDKLDFPLKHPDYLVRSKVYEDHKFYPNQRVDELMSYREFAKMLWYKTVKKLRGINSIQLPK